MYTCKNWRFFQYPKYKDTKYILFDIIFETHELHIVDTHVLFWDDDCVLMIFFSFSVTVGFPPKCEFSVQWSLGLWSVWVFRAAFTVYTSCRTVALWFYMLVSEHNATDPVMQKSCYLRRKFSALFKGVFFHFPSLFKQISFVTSM
jgi:hypothetical protein